MSKKLLAGSIINGELDIPFDLPVTEGLICWLDCRTVSPDDTVWVDRSDNKLNFSMKRAIITALGHVSSLSEAHFNGIINMTKGYTAFVSFVNHEFNTVRTRRTLVTFHNEKGKAIGFPRAYYDSWNINYLRRSDYTDYLDIGYMSNKDTVPTGHTFCYKHGYTECFGYMDDSVTKRGFVDNYSRPTFSHINLYINTSTDDHYFNGDISDFILFNRELSDGEIMQIMPYLKSKRGEE